MSLNNITATNSTNALFDAGDFVQNKRVVSNNQILYFNDPVSGLKCGYIWKGSVPHVTSTNNPSTDGGISATAWMPIIYSGLKEKMASEGLTLNWSAHLPTVEVAYGLPKNSLKIWTQGSVSTSTDYWLYNDGTVWNGVGTLGATPAAPFEQITPNFNASIKTYTATATDGQTIFNVPFAFTTINVFVNGSLQIQGMSYDVAGSTVTFSTPLEADDIVYAFLGNPNITVNDKVNRIYTTVGSQGQTQIQVPYSFSTALVYINGVLQNPSSSYSIGANNIITLAGPLYQDDEVVVMCGDVIVSTGDYVLKNELIGTSGASSIGTENSKTVQQNLNMINQSISWFTPEMFLTDLNYAGDYDSYIQQAIDAAQSGNVKMVKFTQMYPISNGVTFNIPAGITIEGTGSSSGVVMTTASTSTMHNIFEIDTSNVTLKNFSIFFNTAGKGSIGAVQTYGVFVSATATMSLLDTLNINGKYTDSVMGFSNGVRLTGTDNVMKNCVVLNCSMGATVRGTRLSLLNNYCDNGYTTTDGTIWTSAKPQWDGIACEGIIDCVISGNTCMNNGQSGIYIGGGGSGYSNGCIITNNRSIQNWNRGIDTGISGSQSSTNDVTNFIISNNYIRNNRETQLWLYGTNNTQILGNKIIETAEYDTLYVANPSTSRAAIAFGQSAWCVNNILDDNDVQVRATTPFGVVLNGVGHVISQNNKFGGGASNYWFGTPVNMLYSNKVEYYKASFTPVLRAGSSGVSLTSGKASYTIRNNEVEYDIELLMSGNNGSGNLYVGTLPATAGLILDSQEVVVSYWTGFTWALIPGSQIQAYFVVDDPAQISIVRKYGSDTINDIPSCVGVGTRLRIKARATINTTTKTDNSPGVSFFGHSFLSEQGFANGVSESLGKRCYNFARGGSSSTEAALVFGAIQHSYMPVGGTIPASGSVDLSPNENSVWYAGSNIATVTLAGVQGTISSSVVSGITTKLTFTRTTAGTAVSVPSPVPMVVLPYVRQNSWNARTATEHSTFRDDIVIIQCLRNDSSWEQGIADIDSIVTSLGTNKFVILSEFPYASETTGTAGANTVSTYNDRLKAAYPNNYCQINGVDLLQNFKNNYNPAYPQDVTDIANGVTPSSLRYDTLHPSRYRQENALRSGVQVNSEFVARFIKSKGW